MNQMDWKDALGKAFNVPVPDKNDPTAETAAPDAAAVRPRQGDALQQQGKQMLDVVLERKGRAGKQATIVTGFVCDEAALKEVASQLKRHLGVGGSARGGEILIQGDFRQRVLDQLHAMGFKARVV
ncbi:MAG: translation initiation factor [Muribaculaceae bacterium]|nr:translation initiation factor [Muribaculaceae bacterium]